MPGRLRLTLRDGVLVAANTGAPLDAAGVESLSTLRASAKRDTEVTQGAVGRFGVGFAAVLAVTDEPAIVGRHGGVRWSLAEARELAADVARHSPGLGDEVRRRDGHVPLLRLPFAAEGTAPEPYDTAVILPLRDAAAAGLAERLLDGVDDALLLTLPGLAEVVVEIEGEAARTLSRRTDGAFTVVEDSRDGVTNWRTASGHGPLDADLLADRPVEERLRPHWSVTWAVPVDAYGAPARPRTSPVVHAPTPSDEPLGVPALLIASFPLDTTRRHAAPGPLTDFLVQRAADVYAELLAGWRPVGGRDPRSRARAAGEGRAGRGAAAGRPGAVAAYRLPAAGRRGEGRRRTAGGPAAPGRRGRGGGRGPTPCGCWPRCCPPCCRPVWSGASSCARSGWPGCRSPTPSTGSPGWRRGPSGGGGCTTAWRGVDPDRLSGLPVPLGDGRTTIGPRQVLLPTPDGARIDADVLGRLGLKGWPTPMPCIRCWRSWARCPPPARGADHAAGAGRRGGLSGGRRGLGWEEDAPDAEELAETVLGLVRDAGLEPGDEPWLGALALPDEDGELAPAGELVFPGSPFARVIREGELAAVDAELAEKWGSSRSPRAGCSPTSRWCAPRTSSWTRTSWSPGRATTPSPTTRGCWTPWTCGARTSSTGSRTVRCRPSPPNSSPSATWTWWTTTTGPRRSPCWPGRRCGTPLTQPVRILLPDGTHEVVRPYTAWWLRGHPVLDGRRPAGLLAAGGDPLLRGLYDEADATGFEDEQVLRALGVRTSVGALLDEPGGAAELLDRLADPERPVTPAQLHGLYSALAELEPEQVTLPDELRAVVDGRVEVVDAGAAVVVDSPDLLPFTSGVPLLPVRPARAAELAELFQVRRLSESVTGAVHSEGTEHDVPDSVRVLLGPRTPQTYVEHEELVVDGVEIDWRLTDDGVLHAATLEGVAAGLAWAAGQWPRRFEVAALLEDPSRTEELARDRWFD